jgi:hypothetical protein
LNPFDRRSINLYALHWTTVLSSTDLFLSSDLCRSRLQSKLPFRA